MEKSESGFQADELGVGGVFPLILFFAENPGSWGTPPFLKMVGNLLENDKSLLK